MGKSTHLWMCGASDNDNASKEGDDSREKPDAAYVLEPFPKKEFKPLGWIDVLATLDVCVDKITPIVFCDEEGYDIMPLQMVNVFLDN